MRLVYRCTQMGLTLQGAVWLNALYIIGVGSPAIASYIILKRNGEITGARAWLKNIFTVKRPVWMYLFTIALCSVYYIVMVCVGGVNSPKPIYMLLVLLPVMLVGGGHEEAGWRYILQPALDKKLGFIPGTLVVGLIWALWHLPLFFIPGVGQYGSSFLVFAVYTIGTSFALGAIRRITDSVFLCVLYHCLFNAASTVISSARRGADHGYTCCGCGGIGKSVGEEAEISYSALLYSSINEMISGMRYFATFHTDTISSV